MKKLLTILFITNLVWGIFLSLEPSHVSPLNYLFNLGYGLNFAIATYASFSFMKKCKIHHPIHITMGIGSLSFFIAQIAWLYYNMILHTEIPYPGIADLFWVIYYPLTAIGGIIIMREIKVLFTWDRILEMFITFGVIFFIIYSFISANSIQENLPLLTQLLNLSYPFFDALLLTLTLTSIRSQLGNLQPLLLYFMAAFIALTFSDTLFAYQTTLDTYWNGNIVDIGFAVAGYFYALGVVSLPQLLHTNEIKSQVLGTESRV